MTVSNFIVFEGIDGAGTTTQLNILKDKLKSKPSWFTAEPTIKETGDIYYAMHNICPVERLIKRWKII